MQFDKEKVTKQINACMKHEKNMTNWERGFILSISKTQRIPVDYLTDTQIKILNGLWEKFKT